MTDFFSHFFFEFIWKFEILFISLHQENKNINIFTPSLGE